MKTLEECISKVSSLDAAAEACLAGDPESELFEVVKDYAESILFYLKQFKEEAEI